MILTKEQQAILDGAQGETLAKVMKTLVMYGETFGADKLAENFTTLLAAIIKAKPAAAKGQYIKSCVIASTMGPGIRINSAKLG